MTKQEMNVTCEIVCNPREIELLKDVYQLLKDGNVIGSSQSSNVVDFKHPEELKNIIDLKIPAEGVQDPEDIKQICETIIKYSLKTSHPHFHNQLFGGVDPYGLFGSFVSDALNTSQYTYEVAPVFTLMENEVIQTFCKLFGFVNGDGIFTPGGSLSNMYGVVLARYQARPEIKTAGCFGSMPLVAFTSNEAHYSIRKSVQWLGIGSDNLIIIKTDDNGCMLVDDLILNIENVLKENRQPFFVNATAGSTVLGAFDDMNAIADVCEKYGLWMHVDGCLGGSIILSNKYRHRLSGIDRAKSISWNPHKSLGVPLQCSLFLVKENGLLHQCNSSAAVYLFQQDKFYDVSYDTGDKSIQCGRKVDVFKFWLMLKARGFNGFERLIDNAIEKSNYLTEMLSSRDGYRLVRPTFQYTNVAFWFIPKRMRNLPETKEWWNELYNITPLIKERMIKRGKIMIGYTPLPSKGIGNFFRFTNTCFPLATEESMNYLLKEFESVAEEI